MLWWILVISGLGNLFLLARMRRLRLFLRSLSDQVRARKTFLYLESDSWARRFGLEHLVHMINDLLEDDALINRQRESYLHQIETTLSHLAEAVFIVNEQREIFLANPAARTLLNLPPDFHGLRLETVLSSSGFLEFMERILKGEDPPPTIIELSRRGSTQFFEVSGSIFPNANDQERPLMIFVLHDITRMTQLENMRKDFVANVSHELRTPVTIIKGYSETLREDFEKLSDQEHRHFLEKITRNTSRLHALLEDLLELSRLEAGDQHFSPSNCDLAALIEEIIDQVKLKLGECPVQLSSHCDERLKKVRLDILKIHQVLQNLTDNALRHARGMTELSITAELLNNEIHLKVSDNGVGIPERDLARIFERFYRVDKGRARELGGTGLGLSIVKHIAQLHGGEARATSAAGQGTEILIILPYHSTRSASVS